MVVPSWSALVNFKPLFQNSLFGFLIFEASPQTAGKQKVGVSSEATLLEPSVGA